MQYYITYCDMNLGEKIRHLRLVEGNLRGWKRALTQSEVVEEMDRHFDKTISQSYLSQIESGARPHITHGTRQLLAGYFRVHPGFLVDDVEGFQTDLGSAVREEEGRKDAWLYAAADNFRDDPRLGKALTAIADHADTRKCLLLLGEIVKVPGLVDHLHEVLKPSTDGSLTIEGAPESAPANERLEEEAQP
jgi:transcriptional regulator with XRE-family HTH domain